MHALSPGFKSIQIRPAGRETSGVVPTPLGDVMVEQDVSKGWMKATVPRGASAVLSLMLDEHMCIENPHHNDLQIHPEEFKVEKHGDRSWLTLLKPVLGDGGSHTLRVDCPSQLHSLPSNNSPFPPAQYAASVVQEDRTTQGNWMGVYGKEGYIIFGAGAHGRDIVSLPAFISDVHHPASTIFLPPYDSRALQLPSGGDNQARGLGSGLGGGIFNVAYVDILLRSLEGEPYFVSAYFCDYDCPACPKPSALLGQVRVQAVAAYDYYSRDTVAAITLVSDFSGGVWITWRYDKSMRLRFPRIAGDNPVLSALMFDTTAPAWA